MPVVPPVSACPIYQGSRDGGNFPSAEGMEWQDDQPSLKRDGCDAMYRIRDTPEVAMSTMLHVRMDEDLKEEGTRALRAMGLSPSDAVRILFRRIVDDQAFPLDLKVPNRETQDAMAEADAIVRERRARFEEGEDLIDSLEQD
jgi:DNA-damage-inducible protein J